MLNKVLSRFEEIFISIALLTVSVILFVNVVTRYGFGYSMKWAEELTRYVLVWITFVGGSYCVREHAHVGIDAFVMRFPSTSRWVINLFVFILSLLYCVALVFIGWQLTDSVIRSGQVSPTMMIPMYWAYAAIPVGGALMTIRYIQVIVEVMQKRERFNQKTGGEDTPW